VTDVSAGERFEIGSEVLCSDGTAGKLVTVVVNPVARAVAHLVVEPEGRWGLGRLVPLRLVTEADAVIRLSCTLAEFAALDRAEETRFVPGTGSPYGYDSEVLGWPYYQLGPAGEGVFQDFGGNAPRGEIIDTLPVGEVAIHRGDQVHAVDGAIGHVRGLVIDPHTHGVSHVLLQEGHLFGRKEVAIPIGDVSDVKDGIHLRLDKAAVKDLPAVHLQD
jgi:sporulation protein YlmC with PRC-barrel domain